MGPVLPRSQQPIDFAGRGVDSTDNLVRLRREPNLAVHKIQPMRSVQYAKIDRRQRLRVHQINHSESIELPTTVVRDPRHSSVCRGHHLVRIVAHRHLCPDLQSLRVHNRQRVVALRQHEQGIILLGESRASNRTNPTHCR